MDFLKKRFWLNVSAFVALLLTAVTGLVNLIIFLAESFEGSEYFLGLPEKSWIILHVCFALIATTLILIHIILHGEWISLAMKKIGKKNNTASPKK